MVENLIIGNFYRRAELDEVFSTKRFSNSREGIVSLDGNIVLFCTLEKTLKDEHLKYNDYFENDFFRWDSQNPQHIDTPMIQKMVQSEVDIYLFCRILDKINSQTQPFVYCGKLEFSEHFENTSKPVHLIFESLDYQDNPNSFLKEIYDWRPDGKKTETNRGSIAYKVSKRRSTGQGYESDPKIRKAIELHAMKKAIHIYEAYEYSIEDTSANNPYDLFCTKEGKKDRKVEVKGTRGLGDKVILTINEVKSAKEMNTQTDLVVVHSISIDTTNDDIIASGGEVKLYQNWVPYDDDLTPTQFEYKVPKK